MSSPAQNVSFSTPSGALPIMQPVAVPLPPKTLDEHGLVYSNTDLGKKNTQLGWTGTKVWKDLVNRVRIGGTIEKLLGKIPTRDEAIRLIQDAGGRVDRIEGPHAPPNPHYYNNINYTTPSGTIATIQIQDL